MLKLKRARKYNDLWSVPKNPSEANLTQDDYGMLMSMIRCNQEQVKSWWHKGNVGGT